MLMIFLKRLTVIALMILLISCGTARGIFYGTGAVLEGMATDAKNVGDWIK